jgi:rRNA-processing protein FCF1
VAGTPRTALVGDADVLIDIADSNEAVLALIVQHLARVIVPTPVLAEVDTLDELKCAALGLEVLEPTLDQLREAAVPHPALSFADRVCLIVARDAGATCWTNDGPLGDECDAAGVPRMRGLRPILALVGSGTLSLAVALGTVELISANNPYITPAIVEEFRRLAGEADRHGHGSP